MWRGLSVCGRGRWGTGLLVTSSLAGWARTQSDPWLAVAFPDGMGPTWGPVGPRWAPCWPHETCYQGKAGTVGPFFATVMYLDHLLTNSIMITFASVINENIVHIGIERYIMNHLSKTLSGHPFHSYYHYHYYYYYYFYFFIYFIFYLNVILIQIEIDYYS